MDAIDNWRELVNAPDPERLALLIHPDAVFESPLVHSPQVGRDFTLQYLFAASVTIGGPKFRFVNEWRNERGAVLEFINCIDGTATNGVDIITVTDDGSQIIGFKVMLRPFKAIELIGKLMSAQLSSGRA